ncbi:hypothetical protein [Actinomadura atramentaria]|uniref:hypothetical protein n=1 Tax=Actinomadura atramentaria TaxID=1990 RepID=UPI00035FD303|nr:hypothetical protein [Actinomadura atramentaria]
MSTDARFRAPARVLLAALALLGVLAGPAHPATARAAAFSAAHLTAAPVSTTRAAAPARRLAAAAPSADPYSRSSAGAARPDSSFAAPSSVPDSARVAAPGRPRAAEAGEPRGRHPASGDLVVAAAGSRAVAAPVPLAVLPGGGVAPPPVVRLRRRGPRAVAPFDAPAPAARGRAPPASTGI